MPERFLSSPAPKPSPRPYAKRDPTPLCRFRRALALDAAWSESDHPRASIGQFGAGSKVHIVTTHDSDTGETTFHHVGTDERTAAAERAKVEEGDEARDVNGDDSAEHHAVKLRAKPGERTDEVRIVHSGDGKGGVDVHGAFASYGHARAAAHDASKAEWEQHGETYADAGLSDLEATGLAEAWNADHAGDHDDVEVKVDGDRDLFTGRYDP